MGPPQQEAFCEIKQSLITTPVLTYYDPRKQITLSPDASSYGLGAVILQETYTGRKLPMAYASRDLTSAERRYSQIENEGLAVVWAYQDVPTRAAV